MEKKFIDNIHLVFEKKSHAKELEKELDKAYKKIGKLEVDIDFLSKILENY